MAKEKESQLAALTCPLPFLPLLSSRWVEDFATTLPLRSALPSHFFGDPTAEVENLLGKGHLKTSAIHLIATMDQVPDPLPPPRLSDCSIPDGVFMSHLLLLHAAFRDASVAPCQGKDLSHRLTELFDQPQVVMHQNMHKPPTQKAAAEAVAVFLRSIDVF